MMLIDTHTHLYAEEFDADRQAVMNRAIEQGVKKFFLPNVDSLSVAPMLSLSEAFPGCCYPMIGLHPCYVKENYRQELEQVKNWLVKNTFYAIGEIGIDLYWDKTFASQQEEAFEYQLLLAKQEQLPVVIHTRNAFDEAFRIVKSINDDSLKGIFHCFSGTLEEAKKVIDLGNFKLGIGGVLTFKNSDLDKVVTQLDLKHLVLETDAPYLAPIPYRGKRNESAYVGLVAAKLAELKNCSLQEIAERTTNNAAEIFDRAFID
jgi:TatD DNase family protein